MILVSKKFKHKTNFNNKWLLHLMYLIPVFCKLEFIPVFVLYLGGGAANTFFKDFILWVVYFKFLFEGIQMKTLITVVTFILICHDGTSKYVYIIRLIRYRRNISILDQ